MNTGLIQDFDPRVPFLDELQPMGDIELPESFKVDIELPAEYQIKGMEYEYQGKTMTCVSNAVTTMAEFYTKQKTGVIKKFSQVHLFFNSGGTSHGSSIYRNLETARTKGLIPYSRLPMPDNPNKIPRDWFITERNKALSIPFDEAEKIVGYFKVQGDWKNLKKAMYLYKRPIMVAVRINRKYYTDPNWLGSRGTTNHVLLIAGWDDFNRPIMFDTLGYARKTGGYRTFGAGYQFAVGYMIGTLRSDWKEVIKKKREKFEFCLNHYGRPRRLLNEQETAKIMRIKFEKFKNQSVLETAGRFWTVYINAIVYGDYSYTDVINDAYNWRRTGEHIFNFNKLRKEYGKI